MKPAEALAAPRSGIVTDSVVPELLAQVEPTRPALHWEFQSTYKAVSRLVLLSWVVSNVTLGAQVFAGIAVTEQLVAVPVAGCQSAGLVSAPARLQGTGVHCWGAVSL